MDEKIFSSSRGEIYYKINKKDTDRAILFLHGLTADHTLFDLQIEEFYKHYSVIAEDMPLHGKSRPYSGFTYENVAKDIYELLRSEGISNVAVVGQSG